MDIAISRISKRKAIGNDLISLIPLDGRQALNIKINEQEYDTFKESVQYKVSKKDWMIMVRW